MFSFIGISYLSYKHTTKNISFVVSYFSSLLALIKFGVIRTTLKLRFGLSQNVLIVNSVFGSDEH